LTKFKQNRKKNDNPSLFLLLFCSSFSPTSKNKPKCLIYFKSTTTRFILCFSYFAFILKMYDMRNRCVISEKKKFAYWMFDNHWRIFDEIIIHEIIPNKTHGCTDNSSDYNLRNCMIMKINSREQILLAKVN